MAATGYRDYYKVLGVNRDADSDSIKRAFRKLARQYHPDVNQGDSQAEARFKEINEAYEVLSDSDKRRRYEQFGRYWNQPNVHGASGPVGAGFDFGQYRNFDEFVNDLLGRFAGPIGTSGFSGGFSNGPGFHQNASRATIDLDAEVKLQISFAEAFTGTERTLAVNEERVKVVIPKGVRSGSRLRLKGKGNLQPGTGRRGDLYLKVDVQTHSIWTLDGDHVKGDMPVSIDEFVLGAEVTVLIPDGEAKVRIPPGTAPGQSLRLKGKGWPISSGRGDLILTLVIDLPENWSSEELNLFEQLQRVRFNEPRKSWLKSARL